MMQIKTAGFMAFGACALLATMWATLVAPIATAEDKVRTHLKDPDSARFDGVAANPKTGAICGSVNAKNSHGGYTGRTGFVLVPTTGEFLLEPQHSSTLDDLDAKIAVARARVDYTRRWVRECPDDDDAPTMAERLARAVHP